MKITKRTLACLCALTMATTSLPAFSVTAAESTDTSAASSQTTTNETQTTVKVGKVTAVNGSSITVALGEFTSAKKDSTSTGGEKSTDSAKKTKPEKKADADSSASGSDTNSGSASSSASGETAGKRSFGKKGGSSASNIRMDKSRTAGMEINLLGKTVDEAVSALDKFIDDAYLAHITTVRIIHGKGTGRLREGVHQYLRSHRLVKSFKLAEFGEGDAGVTIANLRED